VQITELARWRATGHDGARWPDAATVHLGSNGIAKETAFGYAHHTDPWSSDNGIRVEQE
jgi:hypothetical protein